MPTPNGTTTSGLGFRPQFTLGLRTRAELRGGYRRCLGGDGVQAHSSFEKEMPYYEEGSGEGRARGESVARHPNRLGSGLLLRHC